MQTSDPRPAIVVICGPTGVGKTGAAIAAAKHFNGEIIGSDSVQIYRRLDIGSAKPTRAERDAVPHHLVDILEPDAAFDARRFAEMAGAVIRRLSAAGKVPFVVGGTGLYIKALLHGLFEPPAACRATRRRLQQEAAAGGGAALHQRLAACDPAAARRIHPNDSVRIVRALEIFEATGRPISDFHARHRFAASPFRTIKIGLRLERSQLYERINRRVEAMLAEGLLAEVAGLLQMGFDPGLKPLQSLGYRHMIAHLNGTLSLAETLRTLKRDTRRYAKRQMTWFAADPTIIWTTPTELPQLYPQIAAFLAQAAERGGAIDKPRADI
ncbi:MAG: tRNA (adenosine(37)-N6)-dimethylallyltransferase MiaA [Desulfobacteraceae bacterium]|jgi:tRNA dimethylallyltransferase|nr:tRNA (adenosine(37)-N6)-dimethylallyltransferase MiaA [Desulfobacteraceae bacterium]